MILRDYQIRDLDRLRELIRAGEKRILLVQPTGAGKGTLSTFIIEESVKRGKKVVFLVNLRELVHDMSRRLDRLDIDHGIVMADNPRRSESVNIASVDTLYRRSDTPNADLVFVDEAHFSVSPMWKSVLDRFGEPVIGMTATPIRGDGKGLGSVYTRIVTGPSVADLTAAGYLVPAIVYAPKVVYNVDKVQITAGEYNQKQLAAVVDRPRLVGDIVGHWRRLASERKTVLFAVNVKHSKNTRDEFRAAGIEWEHVDANTPDEQRDQIWDRLDNGSLCGVSSVGVISYGWDHPRVSCVILARPTMSLGLHLQQCGRGLRPASGKTDLLILDHAGNTARHGFVEDPREWSLNTDEPVKRLTQYDPRLAVRMCGKCWAAFSAPKMTCPRCGAAYHGPVRRIEEIDGTLERIQREQKAAAIDRWRAGVDDSRKRSRFMELQATARARGYKPGWAAMMFKTTFGHWPKFRGVSA